MADFTLKAPSPVIPSVSTTVDARINEKANVVMIIAEVKATASHTEGLNGSSIKVGVAKADGSSR